MHVSFSTVFRDFSVSVGDEITILYSHSLETKVVRAVWHDGVELDDGFAPHGTYRVVQKEEFCLVL